MSDMRWKHRIKGKRLLFTVTTGRSGTGFLAALLRHLPDVAAFHEPEPSFDTVMRAAQTDPRLAAQFWTEQKLPAITQSTQPIYVETSHLFSKGFFEPLVELGCLPDLVALRREPRDVALSMYRLDVIPGRTPAGIKFLVGPEDPGVLPVNNWKDLHDYQLCYWYCLEMERRTQRYKTEVLSQGGRFHETSINELTKAAGFVKLTTSLDLPSPGIWAWLGYLRTRGRRVNTKAHKKRELSPMLDFDTLEDELRQFIDPYE